ncbi:MAG TPA: thiamine-phosphate kinase [Arachnia sp.]|nr:thiamine-phosphate kinase [Arachnia sp.]HMT86472.1 thiamine-phosphate kinase [Arachnia sp.]
MGEFEMIDDIIRDLPRGADVVLGPGDDCAVLRPEGDLVITTDALIEGVHFKRQWSPAEAVGRKTVAVNVSDVEAMGAKPSSIVVTLAVPKDLDPQWVADFTQGVRAECELAGVSLVGGDVSSAPVICLSGTAVGSLQGRAPLLRSGAGVGDIVAYRGRLGVAGAGLAALSRGFRSPIEAVREQQCPTVPYGQGAVAARAGATAMMDVSDGLIQDLGHIARASGVAIDIDTTRLELPDPVVRVAAATGRSGLSFVLTGGEDHALAGTFPAGTALPDGWRRIGRVLEGDGVLVDGAGFEGAAGWDHFS